MLVCLSVYLPFGALAPVLPVYVREELGEGDLAVGIVMGGFGFAALLARPLAGALADRIDRRRTAVVGGLLCAVSGMLYFVPGLGGVASARVLLGLGEALVTSATMAWAIDLAPPDRRGRMIGLFGLSIWAGLGFGPPLGALLAQTGYAAVWILSGAAPLAGALLALRLRGGTLVALPEPMPTLRQLVPRGVMAPGFGALLIAVAEGVMGSFLVLHLAERHLGGGDATGLAAAVYAVFAGSIVVMRLLGGSLVDRYGGVRVVLACGVAEAAGLSLIAAGPGRTGLFGGAVLAGAAFALLFPALGLLAINAAPTSRRAAAAASFTAFFDSGFAIGGVVGGLIASWGSYTDAFWFAAAAALGTVAVVAGLRRSRSADGQHLLDDRSRSR